MNRAIDWQPVPILIGLVEAGGPVDHAFFEETLAEMPVHSKLRCRSMPCTSAITAP